MASWERESASSSSVSEIIKFGLNDAARTPSNEDRIKEAVMRIENICFMFFTTVIASPCTQGGSNPVNSAPSVIHGIAAVRSTLPRNDTKYEYLLRCTPCAAPPSNEEGDRACPPRRRGWF